MKYAYVIYKVNREKGLYEPFAIAKGRKAALWRVRRFNLNADKTKDDFFQAVRIEVENGGYFDEKIIIKD